MLTLNLTLPMGKSSEGLIVSPKARSTGDMGLTYGIYCRKSGRELLCIVEVKSACPFLYSIHARGQLPYPVPHCSTLVTFSCRRLLSHASSSCLQEASVSEALQ